MVILIREPFRWNEIATSSRSFITTGELLESETVNAGEIVCGVEVEGNDYGERL